MPTLGEVVDLVHGWYPPETADDWDAVGLAAGDPDADVRRILLAVDPALPVAREAADWDADLLLTHHPLFLRGVHGVAESTAKGRTLATLTRARLRASSPPTPTPTTPTPGVSDALARALGLHDVRPVDAAAVGRSTSSSCSPRSATPSASAPPWPRPGAGRIGDYDTVSCIGRRRGPVPAARRAPARRSARSASSRSADEAADRGRCCRGPGAPAVVRAMLAAHPYEEVAYDVIELADPGTASDGRRPGRRRRRDHARREFADTVAAALPATAARRAASAATPTASYAGWP